MVRSSLSSWKLNIPTLALGLALGAAAIVPAFAAGGGGDPPPPPTCAKGQVFNAKNNSCVKAERDALPDEEMTQYAYALAKEDRFAEALNILDMLENPNTAKALNYRGFATRKLGRTEEGISYYLKSVALDLTHRTLADLVGASREKVTRAIGVLQQKGLLKVIKRREEVQELIKLRRELNALTYASVLYFLARWLSASTCATTCSLTRSPRLHTPPCKG